MDPKVTDLYNEYIHGDMPRRSFLKRLAVITGGASMANAVLARVKPNYALGQQVKPDDDRLQQCYVSYPGTWGPVMVFTTTPARRVMLSRAPGCPGSGASIFSTII
jgi:carboxymethylenebutenolidase